ncbi:MAG: DUF2213 domain-containing protein [Lentisphaerota bacterium]
MDKLVVGKVIKMPCMRRGLCAYSNETILVSQEALQQLSPSMMGVPVVIDHPDQIITEDNIATLPVVGRVADMHYVDYDDTWYAHFVIDDQRGIDLLEDGWGVSTAWFGDKYANGGTHNNVGYDRELLEGRYEHLAIVKSPRYEMAKDPIFLNSNDAPLQTDVPVPIINDEPQIIKTTISGVNDMIGKLFKKLITREELKTNDNEEIFVLIDGKDEKLSDIVSELSTLRLNAKKNEDDKEKEKENEKEDDEEEGTEEVKKSSKKNKKANESEDDKKDEKGEKKENSLEDKETEERFNTIRSIHMNGVKYELQDKFLSLKDRLEMGQSRYGSGK